MTTREEQMAQRKIDWPVGRTVTINGTHLRGTVSGHPSYVMAFIGFTTFIEVKDADGYVLGEYAPDSLEAVR